MARADFILHTIEMEIISNIHFVKCDAKNVLLLSVCGALLHHTADKLCTRKVISVSHIVYIICRHMPRDLFFSLSNTCCLSSFLSFFFCFNKRSTHSGEKMLIDNAVRYFFCFRSHCASKIVITLP